MAKSPAYTLVQDPNTAAVGGTTQKHQHHTHRPWQPGFLRRFPWSGILSLFLALACAIAAVVIALISDQKKLDYFQVAGYTIQPAVLLSIFATVGNALIVFAFTQGATIHWWRSGFKGATLQHLHSSYHYGTGALSAFTSLTALNTVAIASVFVILLLMDGPLFQRASSVTQRSTFSQAKASVPVSPSPYMAGTTGILADHHPIPSMYHPLFASVLVQYFNRTPIVLPASGCDGTCHLEIVAPGWDIDCTQSTRPFRLISESEQQQQQLDSTYAKNGTLLTNSSYTGPAETQTMFKIDVIYNYTQASAAQGGAMGGMQFNIVFDTLYKATSGGNGTLGLHTCTLYESIIKYPIILANDTLTLGAMSASQNRTVERVIRAYESETMGNQPSTLGGFWLALKQKFQTTGKLYWVGNWASQQFDNPTASMYLRAPNASAITTYDITWDDPMPDMLSMANELAFRTALAATESMPGLPYPYVTPNMTSPTDGQSYIYSPNLTTVNRTLSQDSVLNMSTPETVYATHRGWLAGGFVVMVLACLAVLPTYYGWWVLGRPVSMSPLEIARAFDAPILQSVDPNATGEDLKKAVGQERVRFRAGADGVLHVDEIGNAVSSTSSIVR